MPQSDAVQVIIDSIVIKSINGQGFDARNIYERLEIQESLFSPSISGMIEIEDEKDHVELIPIIGQETITITFEIDDEIEKYSFRIYKVSNVENENARRVRYRLHFTTNDQINNENTLVRTSFRNMKYSDMVKGILTDFLNTDRKIYVEKTLTKGNRIIPNIRPFKAINQLASNSISDNDQASNYIFFEARDGYFFIPISTFVKAGQPKYTYRYEEKRGDENTESLGVMTDPFRVLDIKVKKSSDFLDAINSGMFSGKLEMIDLVRRKVDKKEYGYFDEFNKFDHINEHPLYIDNEQFDPSSTVLLTYTDENSKEHPYVNDNTDLKYPFIDSELRMRRRIQMQMFKNFVIEIAILGNITLSLGDMINLNMSAKSNITEDRNHRTFTGNSIITSITHIFAKDKFFQSVELSKDSVRQSMEESVI